MDDIKNCKIIKKRLQADRWYVVLKPAFNSKKSMPQAHYNWLVGNPSFGDIPTGYIVHHLDGDKLNDDISNLAIIHRIYHTAYHFKNFKIAQSEIDIEIDYTLRIGNIPFEEEITKLKYRKIKTRGARGERWRVEWYESDFRTGKRVRRNVHSFKRQPLASEEDAKRLIDLIRKKHPQFQQ